MQAGYSKLRKQRYLLRAFLQKVVPSHARRITGERGLPTGELKVGHSYERVMPGPKYIDSIQNFTAFFAGTDKASADATETFLRTVISTDEYPLTRLWQHTGDGNGQKCWRILPGDEHCLYGGNGAVLPKRPA